MYNMDRALLGGVLFLDLKNVFDTVDHHILLSKLELCGTIFIMHIFTDKDSPHIRVYGLEASSNRICCFPQNRTITRLMFAYCIITTVHHLTGFKNTAEWTLQFDHV
jgi:hypothetical protein